MPDEPRTSKTPSKPRIRPAKGSPARAAQAADLSGIVGQNVWRIRKELNLTQSAMAERVGLPLQSIGILERGQKNITLASVAQVAAAFGIDPHVLICGPDYGVSPDNGVTLDTLATVASAIAARVQEMLAKHGPVTIGQVHLASILGAMFDAISNTEKYRPATPPSKT